MYVDPTMVNGKNLPCLHVKKFVNGESGVTDTLLNG
jgi:hypothetical protein